MKTNGREVRRNGRGIGEWLQNITRAWVDSAARQDVQGGGPLPPQGRRSGSGTESLTPFLAEGRSTRPADLE
jgi:hypothetical protein